ncbi:lipid kinase [Candidatus Symbiopectobacterium sp. NZEC127]|uniref:lipid kinase n=1 Tax=Candidatus Symbiopectobacterium sp. NZEC127 TaxID=2820472 RepID=UPI0039B600B5
MMTSQQEPVTALLLINEKARKGDCAREEVLAQLMAQGLRVLVPSAELSMTYSELIEHYADRVDMVIVGGGDGSLNAAAPGLVATGLPLGVLPLGTANDFARTLDIPFDLKSAISVIVAGHRRAVDLGKVNGHLFFNVSSIGFSAVLARELTAESKKRWGTLGYALAACKLLRQSRPFRAEIVHEGAVERVRTVQISVGNGRFYGGGMTVEQRAAPDDGLLDVYSLEVTHWWQMIALIPFLRRGTQGRWRQVRAFSTTELILNTRRPHDINADGELIGRTPAHFTIKQKAIEVFAPR